MVLPGDAHKMREKYSSKWTDDISRDDSVEALVPCLNGAWYKRLE